MKTKHLFAALVAALCTFGTVQAETDSGAIHSTITQCVTKFGKASADADYTGQRDYTGKASFFTKSFSMVGLFLHGKLEQISYVKNDGKLTLDEGEAIRDSHAKSGEWRTVKDKTEDGIRLVLYHNQEAGLFCYFCDMKNKGNSLTVFSSAGSELSDRLDKLEAKEAVSEILK